MSQVFASRVSVNLLRAVEVMKAAVADAERQITDDEAWSIQRVLHALQWGMANASSSIEIAMAALEDNHTIARLTREEMK